MSTNQNKQASLEVNCPTCKKSVPWVEASTYRPFCSERCSQVDLGAWATEAYTIPAEPIEEWSEEASTTTSSHTSYTLQ